MDHLARIVDADKSSLASRVLRALDGHTEDCTVLYFTYWYTGRPPVHEAIVTRRDAA
jgi:hypothetical protein